jgi:membrane-bound metal-dependent hydrolase YbcI (DUF457 family)
MYLEHGIWTLALCVIVGMFYKKYPLDRNPTWIILFAVLLPDTDFFFQTIMTEVFPYKTATYLVHGGFHNVLMLLLFSFSIGWLIWKTTKIAFKDATVCVAIGFIAHLLEDALVNGVVYHFYRPFSERGWYQGFIIPPLDDVVFANNVIGSTNILVIGLSLLIVTIIIRSLFQGDAWLDKYNFVPFLKRNIHVPIPVWITNTLTFYGLTIGELHDEYKLLTTNNKPLKKREGYNTFSRLKKSVVPKIHGISLINNKFDDDQFD